MANPPTPQAIHRVDIVESYFVSPFVLMVTRMVTCCYITGTFFWSFLTDTVSMGDYFRYLTDLSWMGMAIYFGYASLLSFRFVYYEEVVTSKHVSWSFDYFHSCMNLFSWLVPLIFWLLLREFISLQPDDLHKYQVINPHLFDFIFLMSETMLSKISLRWMESLYSLGTILLYTFYVWVLHYGPAAQPFPYPFLDWWFDVAVMPGTTAIAILVSAVIHEILFAVPWGVTWARDRIFGRNQAPSPSK